MNRQLPDPFFAPTIGAGQAALILGVSLRALYSACERGECPSFRVGRRVIIPTERFLRTYGLDGANAHDAE